MNLQVPPNLLEAYAVANTPAFLFKALRADPYVAQLRATYTIEELEANLLARDRNSESLSEIVSAYCQLVAGFSETHDVARQTKLARDSGLRWADRLLALHRAANSISNNVNPIGGRFVSPSRSANSVTFGAMP